MLRKQAALYAVAVVAPAVVGLGTVVIYSRMLAPAEYGHFALVMTSIAVTTGLTSRWLTVGITRLYPAAERDHRADDFVATALAVSAAAIAWRCCCCSVSRWPSGHPRSRSADPCWPPASPSSPRAPRARDQRNPPRPPRSRPLRAGGVHPGFWRFGASLLLNWLSGATAANALLGTAIGFAVVGFAEAACPFSGPAQRPPNWRWCATSAPSPGR